MKSSNAQKITLGTVRRATVSYALRQIVTVSVSFISNLLLTRILLPGEYGVVAIVVLVTSLVTIIADGGLGVYLIQRKADASDLDVSRVFNFQMSVAIVVISVLIILSLVATSFLPDASTFWVLTFATFGIPFAILRGMATVNLERYVLLNKIAFLDVIEQVVFALVAVALAYWGKGVWSIVWATVIKSAVGGIIAILVAPWKYSLAFPVKDEEFMQGLKYAFNYQGAQLINIARTAVNPVFVNGMLGLKNGGYVERANYVNGFPVGIISMIQNKIFFPYAARISDDREKLRRFLEESIYLNSVVDKMFYLPLLLFTSQIITLVFKERWLPMVPVLQLFMLGTMFFGALTGPLYPVINALGASRIIFRFNLISMIASWVLIVPLCLWMGVIGIGVASVILWLGVFWLNGELQKLIGAFSFLPSVRTPTYVSLIVLGLFYGQITNVAATPASIIVWSLAVIFVYAGILLIVEKSKLINLISRIIKSE
jgi:O-antigen/teichoic acid export membrane protein